MFPTVGSIYQTSPTTKTIKGKKKERKKGRKKERKKEKNNGYPVNHYSPNSDVLSLWMPDS